jgi:hypothetical protein
LKHDSTNRAIAVYADIAKEVMQISSVKDK